jgi:hypothetical protein
MSHKTTCEDCGQEVSYASCRTVGAEKKWLCGVCDGSCEPCRQCGSHDVVYSDHGVDLCKPCKDNSTPEQKAWLYEQDYRDAFESGHPMADHMPLPSNWRQS